MAGKICKKKEEVKKSGKKAKNEVKKSGKKAKKGVRVKGTGAPEARRKDVGVGACMNDVGVTVQHIGGFADHEGICRAHKFPIPGRKKIFLFR